MMKLSELDDDCLLTRKQVRQLGLDYSSTQFGRWEEDELLVAVKPGGKRSSRVHYRVGNIRAFMVKRSPKPVVQQPTVP
jgi:hypothetical protein